MYVSRPSTRMTLPLAALFLAALLHFSAVADDAGDVAAAKNQKWEAIDLKPLNSAIHHAVMKFPGQKAPYPQYAPDHIVDIAETLLAYQNSDGGWPANVDWIKVHSDEELAGLPHGRQGKTGKKSTLDNDNTWSEIGYLAQVYRQTRLARYANAASRGIDYLLREQRDSGGWRGSDVEAITFNDGVMAGVLRTLRAVSDDRNLYGFVSDETRVKATSAYNKGIRCVLACQIKVSGRLTAWCEQHDHTTLEPIWARTFEPPSITPDESVDVVRVLMDIPEPSPEVVAAIRAAVAWFEKVKIPNLKIEKAPAEPVTFQRHYSDSDLVAVNDPAAPPIWARYYDLKDEAPIFCNREQKLTREFSELDRERRTGMPWYGYWPAKLLTKEYPAWEKRQATAKVVRLYVIGDSTAAAYTADRYPLTGWAQTLQDYFDSSKLLVEDKAKSGRSAKSFYDEGSWIAVLRELRKGDYVFIQFGHNDSKKDDPRRYTDPDSTYPEYLRRYVEESREIGAVPVLVTSINRNSWVSDKKLKDTLDGYPPAMLKVSKDLHVPLIDLHAMTKRRFERLGRKQTTALFMNLEKGASQNYPDGSADNTHLQEKGAREVDALVVKGIRKAQPLTGAFRSLKRRP